MTGIRKSFFKHVGILLLLTGIGGPVVGAEKPLIITSVFPLQEFASAVTGGKADVICLLPPGAEVHSWKPRPSDLLRLEKAQLFLQIGAGLEPWADDLKKSLDGGPKAVLEAAAVMKELLRRKTGEAEEEHTSSHEETSSHDHDHNGMDPHVWLDFSFDIMLLDHILEIVIAFDAENASEYRRNAAAYQAELMRLDQAYSSRLDPFRGKTFVLGGHAAFGYLARRYGLKQVSLYGLSPNARPKPKQMADIVRFAREHDIRVIFFEQFVSPDLARVLAAEIGAEVRILFTGANRTPSQNKDGVTFIQMMENNLENLCDAFH